MSEDYLDVGIERYEGEDYDLWETDQIYRDSILYRWAEEEKPMKATVYLAVVQNNPGLSNVFLTKPEAVRWIENYLEDYYVLGDCWYMANRSKDNRYGSGDVRAWIVSREISL